MVSLLSCSEAREEESDRRVGLKNRVPFHCHTKYFIFCALSSDLREYVCSEYSSVLCLHIATFDNHHRYETYWFWTACGKNEHVRVRSKLKALFSLSNFLFSLHATWNHFSLTHLSLRPLSLVSSLPPSHSLTRVAKYPDLICWASRETIYNACNWSMSFLDC